MSRTWFSIVALIATASLFLSLSSCGFNQHLVSIQVVPPGATFNSVGASIVFKAMGTYIHPPATKDITNIVTWSVDSQNLVTITNTSLVTAVSICGSGSLTASYYDSPNQVSGSAFLTGGGAGTAACSQAILTVNIVGSGSVTDSTQVIKCPGTCSADYALGSTIGLTATPGAGASQVNWTNCNSFVGNTCTVVLNVDTTVTATFN
jgi:trimeric autotransporter adhesin